MRLTIAALLLCAACGKQKPTPMLPATMAPPPVPPNAAPPADTDPTVVAAWSASHIIATTLELPTLSVVRSSDLEQPLLYDVSGQCRESGNVVGTLRDGSELDLTFRSCGGPALALRASDIVLEFGLLTSPSTGAARGFLLTLLTHGSLDLLGSTAGVLGYVGLDIAVVANDDGTVTMSLSGDATWNGVPSTFANQSFVFPGAP